MTRFEFMAALEQLLSPLPDAERCDALRYYEEYFDAAGPEKEAEVIAELGSPEQLAKKLLEAQSLPTVPTPLAAANARSRQRSRAKWFTLGDFAAAVLVFVLISVLLSAKTGPMPLIQTPSTAVFTSQDTSKHEVESFQQSVSLEEDPESGTAVGLWFRSVPGGRKGHRRHPGLPGVPPGLAALPAPAGR